MPSAGNTRERGKGKSHMQVDDQQQNGDPEGSGNPFNPFDSLLQTGGKRVNDTTDESDRRIFSAPPSTEQAQQEAQPEPEVARQSGQDLAGVGDMLGNQQGALNISPDAANTKPDELAASNPRKPSSEKDKMKADS
ncbi:MAG TPA: hypothetical protein VGD98_16280 [Ktedonobacteraceae bacterium]